MHSFNPEPSMTMILHSSQSTFKYENSFRIFTGMILCVYSFVKSYTYQYNHKYMTHHEKLCHKLLKNFEKCF